MKIFFDFEFIENGVRIWPLSVGMAAEDGRTYYAVFRQPEAVLNLANAWVKEHVLPKITGHETLSDVEIRDQIIGFAGEAPEFWGYFADYDWVALCQLYGPMMRLPKGWPMYARDLKQYLDHWGFGDPACTSLPPQVNEHHALADAVWIRDAHAAVQKAMTLPTDSRQVIQTAPNYMFDDKGKQHQSPG